MEKDNKYWLSLEDYKNSFKDMAKKEFLSYLPSQQQMSSSRREFLQIMSAGLALASTSCLRRPAEKLVPYVNRPKDIIPGEANYYASSFYDGEEGFSTLIKTREGRPIKIEGNELAKILNEQGLSPRACAYILSLYDPERAKKPQHNLFNKERTNKESIGMDFKELDPVLVEELKKGQTALLTNRIPSPSVQKLFQVFLSEFQGKHYVWDCVSREDFVLAQKFSYGQSLAPSYNFSQAEFIFSLNCDFLGTYLSPTEFQKQFAKTRKPNKKMSRLIAFESLMSLTGSNADERYRIQSKDNIVVLMALTEELIKQKAFFVPDKIKNLVQSYKSQFKDLKVPQEKWAKWARLLIEKKGKGLILFGGLKSKNSISAHILVNFLNSALKNDGRTVNYKQYYPYKYGLESEIEQLIEDLNKGKVKRLIIHGVNPLYSYSRREEFLSALKKSELVIYTGDRIDETGFYADYLVPDSHPLEKWCDWEFKKNFFSIQQPAIKALYNTRAFEDSLITWLKLSGSKKIDDKNFYEYLQKEWKRGRSLSFWEEFLKKGVYGFQKIELSPARSFNVSALNFVSSFEKTPDTLFLHLYENSGLKRGDLSNVAWLMEFPDPVTKICWENYLCVSPQMAFEKNLKEGEIVLVKVGDNQLKAPLHIQPGQDDHTLALAVGYGRTRAGFVGNNKGVNAYPLVQKGNFEALPVQIQKTGQFTPLANVQGHHSMEGRDIILETVLEDYRLDESSGIPKHHKVPSLWSKHKYKGHKWGMSIDLNACNGCGTCMIACQSENNIPTVGKNYVLQGREMHWIRVDRYYKGNPFEPEALHQPVVCMHCDNAPCETVCPVLATVHSQEGTNDMVYNRCVGTRYCSNNCPYKVRRFNWFDYTKKEKPLNLVLNPDVTVRNRGVMEKCTFCIQKINEGKARAKKENREFQDGDVKTACQTACPAEAITFGDINDSQSKVTQVFNAKNSYALLDDMLNTKPSVRYRTKIRNKTKKKETYKKDKSH